MIDLLIKISCIEIYVHVMQVLEAGQSANLDCTLPRIDHTFDSNHLAGACLHGFEAAETKAALAKFVEARKAKQAALDKAQADLRKVLTPRQEAIATVNGLL